MLHMFSNIIAVEGGQNHYDIKVGHRLGKSSNCRLYYHDMFELLVRSRKTKVWHLTLRMLSLPLFTLVAAIFVD